MSLNDDVWEYFRRAHEPSLGRLRNAIALAPSPDGKRIVFSGRMLEKLEGTPHLALGVVDLAVGWPHNLDTLPGTASGAAWSGTGTLAYVNGGAKVVVGAEALETGIDGIVEEIAWNADSKRLLVRIAGQGADASGAAGSGAMSNGTNGKPSWHPYVERSSDDEAWRRAYVIDAVTGNVLWLSPPGDNVWEAVWCGSDGIAAIVSDDPSESSWYSSSLVTYAIGGKRRELLTPHEEIGVPAASPDGRYVTAIVACCSDRTIVAGDLVLFDTQSAELQPQPIHTGIDVTHAVWRDSARLLYVGIERMEVVAGEFDVLTGRMRELWRTSESAGSDWPLAWPIGDADAFVTVVDSYGRYQRIVVVENGSERVLCDLGHDGTDYTAQVGGRAERVTWNGRDGIEIDGILVRPDGDGPYPLVVNVHGGPVFSFRNDWSMHYYYVPIFAKYGYAVLNPNPRGSRGRGQDFARMVRGDMCGEDTHDILLGVEAMVERGIADPDRIAVTGRSYGGYMSSWLVTQTQRFAAAIPTSPVTNNFSHHWTANIPEFNRRFLKDDPYRTNGMYQGRSPVFFADRAKTPTLSMAGARDRCTPAGQATEFHRALAENGVACELVIYPEEGHHVDRLEAQADQITRMLDWLNRFMPKKPIG
ncbi:MAG TPA: prolyl oligopeptidase family serine peptidase [Candidatus Baltobacteraceae bacterium]|jgi:dipeptidyl aminopeptidase/acylaminoacyl peptidase|nr:prolyl oligopeptidase family serine peptidase [Candidatus Baltobacteraceae bacterium]